MADGERFGEGARTLVRAREITSSPSLPSSAFPMQTRRSNLVDPATRLVRDDVRLEASVGTACSPSAPVPIRAAAASARPPYHTKRALILSHLPSTSLAAKRPSGQLPDRRAVEGPPGWLAGINHGGTKDTEESGELTAKERSSEAGDRPSCFASLLLRGQLLAASSTHAQDVLRNPHLGCRGNGAFLRVLRVSVVKLFDSS